MSLEESKQSIIDDFSMFDEWLDKYEYIIELGKKLDSFPENKKTDDRLIKGCQSRVWLDWEVKDGKLYFTADSDAIITKGIISSNQCVFRTKRRRDSRRRFLVLREIGLEGESFSYQG